MTLLFRVHKYRVDDLSDCFRRFAKFTRQISQTRLNFDSARKNSLSDAEFLNPTRSETLKKKKKNVYARPYYFRVYSMFHSISGILPTGKPCTPIKGIHCTF